jgi:uncharacterized protein (TIGR03435 family)
MRLSGIRCLSIWFVFAAVLVAQDRPQFEVASIRPSAEQLQTATVNIRISGSQVRIVNGSLKDYVARAYRVRPYQVEGPDWITQERFDISAKLPDGATADQVPDMLQSLLAQRFELKTHRIAKDFPVFALAAGKGGTMLQKSAEPDGSAQPGTINVTGSGSAAGVGIDLGGGSSVTLSDNRLVMKRVTMTQVAEGLTRLAAQPIVDMTRVDGSFDLTLELAPEDYNATLIRAAVNQGVILPPQALRALDAGSANPFSAPLQKYGLTLESRRAPLDVIVVDSMRRTPMEN